MSAAHPCPNCDAAVSGAYCAACGQKVPHGRLDLHELVHEWWHAVAHLDGGIVRLLRDLAVRPGATYAAYFAGARKRYMNPVLFLLLVEGLYILAESTVLDHIYAGRAVDGQMAARRVVLQLDKFKFFLGIPLASVGAWLGYRERYTLAELIVFQLFCFGFITLVSMLGLPLMWWWPQDEERWRWLFGWVAGLVMAWHCFAVFGQRTLLGTARAVALILYVQVAINYGYRILWRLKGYDVDMGLMATVRDAFGL